MAYRLWIVGMIALPLLGQAAEAPQNFQANCTKAWMARATNLQDKEKIDYQNFGEKYCACAAKEPLNSTEAVNKAAQVCISRTLLHDTMDALEEDVGLNDLTPGDIDESCHDRWGLIYLSMSDEDKKATTAYCECAKPKLMDLVNRSEKMTDMAYATAIDEIAATCSTNVRAQTSKNP